MSTAIYQQRFTPTQLSTTSSVPILCYSQVAIPEPNATDMYQIWCITNQVLSSSETRTVTFSACLPSNGTQAVCSSPLLVATVVFDDYTYPISQILTSTCTQNCGTTESISSWVLLSSAP